VTCRTSNVFDPEIGCHFGKETDRLQVANKRVKELEAALADAHIDNCLEHAFLEIACERIGEALSDFKTKNNKNEK